MQELFAFPAKQIEFQLPFRLFWKGSWHADYFESHFHLIGETKLLDPESVPSDQFDQIRDQLWQHTCWEVFFKNPSGPDYWETNLSCKGSWQCYHFASYRQKGADPLRSGALELHGLKINACEGSLKVTSRWAQAQTQDFLKSYRPYPRFVLKCHAGLTYWAPVHASVNPPRPDFHLFE